ncbi:acetyl esterase [Aeromicrobium sp. SORGH_AS981]|uniref:alpha/beta hydrolase n=1 Tax=Aeromicrobium sp. SORGH_AS_0981 TaxID=3041802 RepID=UPI002865F313|nr:alpha/beta hydrolase [Aeromicrobium sp. SORGH_AS_0981]MDR6120235.1 acetyl esterase [Aeromicrobium sp. SORGH_AS_0981]
MALPLRTRVFGVLVRLGSTPIEEVDDLHKARCERLGLQRSAVGRWLFGTADPSVRTTEHHVQVDGRARRFLQHRPTGAASSGSAPPVVLNLHGGGWVQGNPEQSAWFASRVAARTGAVVLSFDYRLAPEDPFPAAVDDAWAALQWVVEHAEELDVDPDRVAVMGDSAGGGLAATTALLARDAGAPALKAEVLIYPGVEMYDRWPSEDEFADAPVLSSANMRAFVRLYLRDQHGTLDWRASPIRAESHAGLPSTLVLVAGHDPLSDNGRRYAETLGEQGVHVVLQEFPDALHGFVSLPGVSPAATQAVDVTARFLRDVL